MIFHQLVQSPNGCMTSAFPSLHWFSEDNLAQMIKVIKLMIKSYNFTWKTDELMLRVTCSVVAFEAYYTLP